MIPSIHPKGVTKNKRPFHARFHGRESETFYMRSVMQKATSVNGALADNWTSPIMAGEWKPSISKVSGPTDAEIPA